MPVAGRLFAVALMLAFGAAHAAEPGQDPLTTPNSPLYRPSPDIRAQVDAVQGGHSAHHATPAALPEAEADNPVPRGLVAVAQRELAALGYDPGPVDGRLGPKTRRALMAFQSDKGLPADGALTFELLSKLMVRVAPAVAAPAPPPPPAPPPVMTWSARRALGKPVHAQAGDLLGVVADYVVGTDRTIAGLVVATTNGYGTHHGKVVVPFTQIGHAITRAVVILPLAADKALPLRDKAQKLALTEGQWLLLDGGTDDVTADTDGKLLSPAQSK